MKNKCTKKPKWFGLFAVLLLLQATVQAGYSYLPESSLWQGSRTYNENNVNAYIEYAVYNTASPDYHNTINGLTDGFPTIGSGQYIYAYQILNLGTGLAPITTFELLGGNSSGATGIGSLDDGHGGLVPSNNGASFIWRFENGVFVVNKHSAFLVFSSNSAPVAGTLSLSTLDEYGNVPPANGASESSADNIPEPATIALLAAGVWGFVTRKKDYLKNTA